MGKLLRLYFGHRHDSMKASDGFWIGAERLLDSRPYFGRDVLTEEILDAIRINAGNESDDWKQTGLDLDAAIETAKAG